MQTFATALLPLLLSAPLPWSEIGETPAYSLTEKVTLGERGPSFPAGTALTFESREPLEVPGAPLELLHLTQAPCEHPEWTSEIEIVTPAGNAEANAVGVQLEQGCRWNVYVETKDLLMPSFLARDGR